MDESVFTALCRAQLPAFFRMACSILHSPADAEDAVQQALIKAWLHREKARPGAERAWMMRILVNESRSLLRKRRDALSIEELPLCAPSAPDTGLQEAIRALPESLRTPLLLKYMEGLTEKEVAAATGLPVSSVKGRLFRARKLLKARLNEEVEP